MFRHRKLWHRAAAVASVLWIGVVAIIEATDYYGHFRWTGSIGTGPGTATITAFIGLAMIMALCFGVPWIAAAMDKKGP